MKKFTSANLGQAFKMLTISMKVEEHVKKKTPEQLSLIDLAIIKAYEHGRPPSAIIKMLSDNIYDNRRAAEEILGEDIVNDIILLS